ncbi:TetR/AcrR family transcriptional regulator [Sphaerisporangium rubeum]|uniref:AcrR family transcriptional regulator n=1 Tax=Sphaerisporangium rubeum TaxID=321317 RepID=A0A7X0IG39_9ACTN|nr:TetR/AcrR family transcriptional regulator [Sphaerisporangium rubeum]MBB6474308.1 AcrR family transcriptional regulator [Sphaerisporangium rubeum]
MMNTDEDTGKAMALRAARATGAAGEPTPDESGERRRRAPAMSADERRQMIVQSALPLVAEYGAAVTTAQIARAAGIGEGTIFRVFADKDEVLGACMAEAASPDRVLRELVSISLEQPLADRLVEAIESLRAYLNRMGAVAGALMASGRAPRRDRPSPQGRQPGLDRETSTAAVRDALTDLFEPDRDALRLSPERCAQVFMSAAFSRGRLTGHDVAEITPAEIVDLFLHGALAARE